eukprot:scaffold4400_cov124-Isochrysis_galbana.AAC.3
MLRRRRRWRRREGLARQRTERIAGRAATRRARTAQLNAVKDAEEEGASSCSRPRHAGSRKASTLVTVQLHVVSRRSRQPCAPSCRASRRLLFACRLHSSQRCVASCGSCERRRLSRQHVMMFHFRPPSSPLHLQVSHLVLKSQGSSPRRGVSPSCGSMSCMVGPGLPHIACMCLQDSSRPRKGYEKAPARRSTSLGTRGVGSFSRPLVPSLPRRHVLGKCACVLVFVLRELDPPLPPRKGDYRVGAQTARNHM